jgi:Ribosome recycling factor.
MQRIITRSIRSFYPRLVARPQGTQAFQPSHLLPQTQRTIPLNRREFANSPALYKKKDKTKKASGSASEPEKSSSTPSEDPFDLSQLHNGISTAIARLKDDLSKLRAGGRFNTTVLESLRVQLSKDSKDSAKLGDLAQVVPKGGRMVTLLAAEEDVSS